MANGKLIVALVALGMVFPIAARAEGTTIGAIQQAADEIAVLKAENAVEEIKLAMEERRKSIKKEKAPEKDLDSASLAMIPPPPVAPVRMEPVEVPIGQGVSLMTIQGVGDRLMAVIKLGGTEINVKYGDVLPSGEMISAINPNNIKITRVSKTKKGVTSKSKTLYFGESSVDFGATPSLPPLPPQQQESVPGMGAPVAIRPGR